MKNKVIKYLLALVVLVCATETAVYAAGNTTSLSDLSVGAASVLESGNNTASAPAAETAFPSRRIPGCRPGKHSGIQ